MDRIKIGVLIFMLAPLATVAQSRLAYTEFGVGIGTLNQSSDITAGGNIEAVFKEIRPAAFVHAKRQFNDWFGMGIDARIGYTEATDANHGRPERRLQSFSRLIQANGFFEIHFLKFGKYHRDQRHTYYLKGGAGYAAWDPTLSTADNKAYPDGIDPQNDTYSGINYQMGFGAKFRLSYQTILGVEYSIHFLNEDTFDGLITNTSRANDGYSGINVYFSYLIF